MKTTNEIETTPSEMGTTGLVAFVREEVKMTSLQRWGRYRRALHVLAHRYGSNPRVREAFSRALVAAEPNHWMRARFARWGKL